MLRHVSWEEKYKRPRDKDELGAGGQAETGLTGGSGYSLRCWPDPRACNSTQDEVIWSSARGDRVLITGGRNLIFSGLSAHPTLWSSPVQQSWWGSEPISSAHYKPVCLLLLPGLTQEHWPCYRSPRSPHERRRRESWIARPWLVQDWVTPSCHPSSSACSRPPR